MPSATTVAHRSRPGRVRTWGAPPFGVAVLHGGPGATGSLAPLARTLADEFGVLEPLPTAHSLEGQVRQTMRALERHGDPPLVVVGHSWGAWLGLLVAARRPELVARLILVGCPPLEASAATGIQATRLARLSPAERNGLDDLLAVLDDAAATEAARNTAFGSLGQLMERVDAHALLPADARPVALEPDFGAYRAVWPEAVALRARGGLLAAARRARCPMLAIHGEADPHPAAGARDPLAQVARDFRFVLLDRCGHEPWRERFARGRFLALLRAEVRATTHPEQ